MKRSTYVVWGLVLFIITLLILLNVNRYKLNKGNYEKGQSVAGKLNTNVMLLRREFKVDSYKVFYKKFQKYLDSMSQLDTSMGDTILFEAKEDCYFSPINKTVNRLSNGNYVICEGYPSKFVAIFSNKGKFIKKLGATGNGPGEYTNPEFVDIKNDTIYCMDSGKKIIRYSPEHGFIDEYRYRCSANFCSYFKVSPINNKMILYNVFQNLSPHMIRLLRMDRLNKSMLMIGNYGKMEDVSVVSRTFVIHGLEVSNNGYIFALDPQRFGYTVFDPDGKELASFYNREFKKLKLLKNISKLDMRNEQKYLNLFFSHSRCRFINYLGKGILGISVENPMKKSDKIIPFYYTFWRVDGKYLGYLKCPHRIVDGYNGTLYYWIEELPKLENGMYGNPMLVSVKIF